MIPPKPRIVLSIAQAWDDANAFIRAELGLLAPVALAFLALPAALSDIATPDPKAAAAATGLVAVVLPLSWLVQLYGSMAIAILALKPGLSVAEALRAAVRRMPAMVGVAAILFVALFVLLVPTFPYLPVPGRAAAAPGGLALLYMLALAAGLMWAGVRLALANFVVAAEAAGPLAAIRRSFALTRGAWWRIFGFVFLFSLFGLVVLLATQAGIGSLLMMAGRLLGQPQAAKVVSALLSATVAAGLSTWLLVVLARIYARLSGWSNGI